MSDIYVPIDYSDVKSAIPPGEDIIYSTLCKVEASSGTFVTGGSISRWLSHVLMTPTGVAYTIPTKKNKPPLHIYGTWAEDIRFIFEPRKKTCRFNTRILTLFNLIRDENFESEEVFYKRIREFPAKIRPILMERKAEWLELNYNNKEIKRRLRNFVKSSYNGSVGLEKARLEREKKEAEKAKKKKK